MRKSDARVSFISLYIPKLLLSIAVVVIHPLLIAPSCVEHHRRGPWGVQTAYPRLFRSLAGLRAYHEQELLRLSGVERGR